jgi:hypothetical protein
MSKSSRLFLAIQEQQQIDNQLDWDFQYQEFKKTMAVEMNLKINLQEPNKFVSLQKLITNKYNGK